MIFHCAINVSASEDNIVNDLRNDICNSAFPQNSLIDIHSDNDHNRSVFTFASRHLEKVFNDAQKLVEQSFENFDIAIHEGVHPRIGIIDVLPFVKYDETNGVLDTQNDTKFLDSVKFFAQQIYDEFEVPIFFYDFASAGEVQSLPDIRKNAFKEIEPNIGANEPHERYGAIALGVRNPLVAINVNLVSTDLKLAKSIAKTVRESNGGVKGVRALGLELKSENMVQVSMNIVDLNKANVGDVCITVRNIASDFDVKSEVELVGLIPRFHFEKLSDDFLDWSGITEKSTIEFHIAAYDNKQPN